MSRVSGKSAGMSVIEIAGLSASVDAVPYPCRKCKWKTRWNECVDATRVCLSDGQYWGYELQ